MRRFGVFELESASGELRKRGVRVRLQEQSLVLLEALLEKPGAVVGRDELKQRLWPEDPAYRTDHNLNRSVKRLRETLGDGADKPRYVETVRLRGYRFVADLDDGAAFAFIGRRGELRQFDDVFEKTKQGHGGLVFIGGEPGVGKTRLAEEMLDRAAQKGTHATFGRCYETEGTPPFIAFSEIVERSARRLEPEQFRQFLGERAAEVARIAPELTRMLADLPPLPALPLEMQRRNLFNGFLEFLRRWSRHTPLLFLLDDIHAADPSSLALVDHLAEHAASMPVLLLATYRDTEVDSHPRFAATLEESVRKRLAKRMGIPRFEKAEVHDLLCARGMKPPDDLVERLFRFTDGNAFYLEEVLQDVDVDAPEWPVPQNVGLVTSRRLERLSDDGISLLKTAAVVGRDFSFELVDALGLPSVFDALEEARRARLIRFDSKGREARYVFEHELIRHVLLDGMSVPRRQRLHAEVADALERVSPSAHAEKAHHLQNAGSFVAPDRNVEALIAAAEDAVSSTAAEDALRFADTALALEASIEPPGMARLHDARGAALWALERWEEAIADYGKALSFYEFEGDVAAVSRVSRAMGIPMMWTNRYDELGALLVRVEKSIGPRDSEQRCVLLSDRAVELAFGPAADYAGALRVADEAARMARSLGSTELEGVALMMATAIHTHHEEHQLARDRGARAVSLLRPCGRLVDFVPALACLQLSLVSLGELDAAGELAEEAEELAQRIGHRGSFLLSRRARAIRSEMLSGSLEVYLSHAHEYEFRGLLRGMGPHEPYARLGLRQFWRGEWTAAVETMDRAVSLEKRDFFHGSAIGGRTLLAAYLGEGGVVHAYEQHAPHLPQAGKPARSSRYRLLTRMIEALAMIGELDEASKLYPAARDLANRGAATLLAGDALVQKIAGIAAAAGQQWDSAEQHFETALHQAHQIPVRIEQPEVRRWYAWMHRARGDRARADALLSEALAGYEELGMTKHAALARTL